MKLARRLIVLLCLAAIVAVAIHPIAHGLFVALLIPILFFFAPVAIFAPRLRLENAEVPAVPFRAVLDTRGPPNA
jgi:hypothetical protein